jgi:hypothetical protein
MRSVPPDPNALDDAWGFEEQDPDSTRRVDSKELFARAGFSIEESAAGSEDKAQAGSETEQKDGEGRITLPPPLPVNEYVSKMMVRRSHPSSEITAVQRTRLSDGPAESSPPVPARRTIPWEPPPVGGSFPGKHDPTSKAPPPRLGLECDEPGVPSRSSGRLGFGAGAYPRRSTLPELDEDLLREPSRPSSSSPDFDDFDALDSPQLGSRGWRAPQSEDATKKRDRAAGGSSLEELNFRLDLGLGFEDPGGLADDEPITPPPGTLRYGLLEEEEERELRGRVGPLGPRGAAVYRPAVVPRRQTSIPDALDSELDQATAPGVDMAEQLRALSPEPVPAASPSSREQMRQRFELGDFGGALVLAEGLLEENANDQVARQYANSCTEMLRQMYQARIGDGSSVLRLAVTPDQLRSLNLDHRAGFLLSCIDGYSSIDEILDVSGMQTLEALRMLYELVQEGIVRSD